LQHWGLNPGLWTVYGRQVLYHWTVSQFLWLFFIIVVLGGTLWHLPKLLQYITLEWYFFEIIMLRWLPKIFFQYLKIYSTNNILTTKYRKTNQSISFFYHSNEMSYLDNKPLHGMLVNSSLIWERDQKTNFKNSTIHSMFFKNFNSFIYMCIHCLGHFSPPFPPRFQAEPVLPLSLILLKRRHKHNKKDKAFLLVEVRITIQRDS
jgi:hypothetical protein